MRDKRTNRQHDRASATVRAKGAGRRKLAAALTTSSLVVKLLAVVVGGATLAVTEDALQAPPAFAHSVAQGNTQVFLEPDDADRLLDRAQAGGGGIQAGDVLDYIIQFEPIPNGADYGIGGYVTFYPPSYADPIQVSVVDRTGNTTYPDVPVDQSGRIENGYGSRGTQTWGAPFAGDPQGSLAQLYGDTGIWYSTSAETAKYVGGANTDLVPVGNNGYTTDPTGCGQLDSLGFCRAHNVWDYNMVNRFGDSGFVGRIVPSGRGNTPHLAGSPIAGPLTHYNLDWRDQVGPWQRVAYPGSQTGTGTAATAAGAVAPTSSTAWTPTSAGVALDENNPDYDDITAVRWAIGGIQADDTSINDREWVRVRLKFTAPPTGCPVDAEVFGGDAAYEDSGKDNMWRYYVPVGAYGSSCLTLEKTGPAYVQPNGNITYNLRVGNITATPLTNVILQDTIPAGTTFVSASNSGTASGGVVTWPTIASMAAGEVRNYTVTVKAPNTNGTLIHNQAVVDSTQTEPVYSQWDTTTSTNVADVTVTKTDVADPVEAGQNATYTLTAHNNGPSTATSVSVTDALPAGTTLVSATPSTGSCSGSGPVTCALGSLNSGASATVSVVVHTTVPGTITNSATVTSATNDSNPDNNSDTEDTTVVAPPAPAISVDKTVYRGHDSGASCPGGETATGQSGANLTYCFTVSNTGDTTLAPVSIDDPDLGVTGGDMTVLSGDLSSLAPGDSVDVYYETTLDGDLTNTATATGTPVDGNGDPLGIDNVTDADNAAVDQVAPAVTVEKTVYRGHDGGASCPGGDLLAGRNGGDDTFCFVVTNTGDTPLAPVTLDDPDLGISEADMTVVSGDLANLAPGATAVLYLEDTVDGDITNTVTATGTPADGNGDPLPGITDVTDANTATVSEVDPAISVAKTVYHGHNGGAGCNGGDTVYGHNGDAITYCFEVLNSDVDSTLAPVTVTDPDLGITDADMTLLSGDLAALPPGEIAVLYYETTIDGSLTNTAVADGTPADDNGDPLPGVDPVSDDDSADVVEVDPSVAIAKTVYQGHDAGAGCGGAEQVADENGAPVTYCFAVTNTGDTPLGPVVLDDPDLGITDADMTVASGDLTLLAPGDTAVVYYETTVDGDLTNTATVTGTPTDPYGTPLAQVGDVTADDTAAVDEVAPAVSVAKTVYQGHDDGASCQGSNLVQGLNGDPVTWCFAVTNTGDTDLSPVTVADGDLGITEADLTVLSGDLSSLAPGDTTVLYYEGTVDGDLTNTATVSGTPVDGGGAPLPGVDDVTDENAAEVDEVSPSITVAKTVYRGADAGAGCPGGELAYGRNGADLTYCFEVTNNGDSTLAPVTLDDANLGITDADMALVSGDLSSLAPGDSAVLYYEGAVDGDLTNTVTVTGTPVDADGDPLAGIADVTAHDTAEVDEVAPAVSVAKSVYAGHDAGAGCPGNASVGGEAGTAVTYCFEVTNTGDTDLAPVTLDDPELAIGDGDMTLLSGDLANLAPGDTAVLYYESTIDGDLTNTVTATGTPVDPDGDPLPGEVDATDDASAEVDQLGPDVSIAKTVYRGHDGGAGCAGANLVYGTFGAQITYCFEVKNTGDVDLAPVTVDDADLGITEADMTVLSGDLSTLAPGDTAVLYVETTVDGDLTNTATVTGTGVDGNGDPLPGIDPVTASDTAEVDRRAPEIEVFKSVYRGHDGGASCAGASRVAGLHGDEITYCFELFNDGDTHLSPVTLDDAALGVTDADMTVLSGDLSNLAPGESVFLAYETTVDGDLQNTAVATATPTDANGDRLPGLGDVTGEDTANVYEVAPAVTVDKSVYQGHDAGAGCTGADLVPALDGDPVTYCFEVTNSGDTALAPVTVADADLAITEADMTVLSGDLSNLAPGDTAVLYYETAVDGDLTNTATVTGTPVDGNGDPLPGIDPVDDDDVAEVDQVAPAVSVAKTVYRGHDDGAGCPGGETAFATNGGAVTYCFAVTNDGDTPLAPVTLDDADLGITEADMTVLSGDPSNLAPGDTVVLYYETAVDGDLTNTATATGTPADGNGDPLPGIDDVTGDDTATVDEVAPAVEVTKTVYRDHDAGASCQGTDLVTGRNGDPVTWCFAVTNTGDTTLAPVTLDDADLGVTEADLTLFSGDLSSLAPGDTAVLYYEGTLDGDLTNTATVTGTPVDGGGDPLPGVSDVTDGNTATVNEVAPGIDLDKTVYRGHDGGTGCAGGERVYGQSGDAVTYCFVATNGSDTDLAPVTVDDPDLGITEADMTVLSGDLSSLAPGDSVILYYETTIDGDLTNTATATGTPVDGNGDPLPGVDPVTHEDTASVDEVAPAVTVAKTVYRGHDDGGACAGAELVHARNGAAVTYCFEVTNTGDTTLAPVQFADADLGIDGSDLTPVTGSLASLDAGDTAVLYYETAVDGDLVNTATVTGTPVNGDGDPMAGVADVTAEDTAEVDEVAPSVTVAKTVYRGHDDGVGCAGAELVTGVNGDAVTYCFEVTNDGDSPLSPVTVADADLGVTDADLTALSGDLASLAPGDTAVLYYETAIDGDLVNTASVTGTPVDGGGDPLPGVADVTAEDTAEVDEVAPAVSVAKTVYQGLDAGAGCPGGELVTARNGAAVTYCFEVTNDGDTTLAPVTVADVDLGIADGDMTVLSGDLASLAPGDTAVLYYESTVDGDLTNTATATGTPADRNGDPVPGVDDVTGDDTAEVDEVAPAVSVAKTVYLGHDAGAGCAGDELVTGVNGDAVTYCFDVTNEGDTPLSPVTLVDGDLGIDAGDMTVLDGDLSSLAPGASATLYYETTVDGDLVNTATVTGTPVDGQGGALPGLDDVTAEDSAEVDEVAPAVSVAKTVYLGHDDGAGCAGSDLVAGDNGGPVTYCFEVVNDGDTALSPVTLVDGDLGIDASDMVALTGDLTSLAAGDSAVLYYETTIDGDLINTASVTGTPVDGGGDPYPGIDDVTDEDSAAVDGVGPAVRLVKTVYQGHDDGAGCPGGALVSAHNGDDVTYCFEVTNNGDTELAPVTVSDADLGIDDSDMTALSGDLSSLAPGDSAVLYYDATVDGDLVNTATASGTPADGNGDPLPGVDDVTDDGTAEVDEVAPEVSVAKTVYQGHDDGASCAGDELVTGVNGDAVTYCFEVTNTGDTTMAPVTVADADLAISESDMVVASGDLSSLAPGESATLYYETTLDGDLVNTATATGTPADAGGDPLPGLDPVTDEDTAEVDEVAPAVSVAKTVYRGHDDGAGCPGGELVSGVNGDAVTYCFEVTNDGDTELAPVSIGDLDLGITDADLTALSGDLASLAPGDTAVLYYEAGVDGDLVNTATATGTPADGGGDPLPGLDPVTDEDTAEVDEVAPAVSIAKTVYRGHDDGAGCGGTDLLSGLAGEAVTYCFEVTNDGDTELAPVTVGDADLGVTDADMTVLSGDVASLAPGGSATLYYETTLDGDLVNTATATGTPADGGGDPLPGLDDVTADDTAEVDEVAPAVSVAKTVYQGHDDGAGCAGTDSVSARNDDPVTYCFEVTNEGDTPLSPVVLADADLGITDADLTVLSGDLSTLAPGESATLYYEATVAGDLVNTVTATGTPADDGGDPLPGVDPVTDEDTATVDAVGPAVMVAKTVYAGHDAGAGCAGGELVSALAGDDVTYCFEVTNNGDTELAPVTVADADLGIDEADLTALSGDLASLAPGDTAVLYYEATIDGDLVNTATATGTPADGGGDPLPGLDDVTDDDTAEVREVAPAIGVAKTVYRGHDDGAGCAGTEQVTGAAGAPVTYCFEVTNNGDTELAPVALTDADLGIDEADMTVLSGDLASLAPGDSAVLYYEAAIDGDLTNTATATGTPADGTGVALPGLADVTADDTAAVDQVAPSMTLLTEVLDPFSGNWLDADGNAATPGSNDPTPATFRAGDTASFRFTVTNTGDAAITDVALDAPQCDEAPTVASGDEINPGVLDVGEAWVLTCEVSDVTGGFTMDAAVTGAALDGPPAGSGAHEVARTQVASISVDKTVQDPGTGDFVDSATLETGADATFQIVVTNTGEVPLAGVSVGDDLGPGCARDFVDTLEAGDSFAPYTCVVSAVDAGFVNTATAVGTPVDDADQPVGEDVTDEDTAVVALDAAPLTDLAITKDLIDLDGDAGTATWQVAVTNVGEVAATEPITVVDELPAELAYLDASGDGWVCEFDDPVVTCVTDTDLAPGESTTFTVQTSVLSEPGDTVTNVARVEGTDDTNTDNNTDDAVVSVDDHGQPVPYIPTDLPRTGADVAGLLAAAGLLILAGLGLRRYGRRRMT